MFDIERVKSLVESTIENNANAESMTEGVEGVELAGVFGQDMCDDMNLAIEESVVDFYEFTAGASAMMMEAALSDPTKVEVLAEAAKAGIGERVKAFFTKIANFFKSLGTKIVAYFTAFTNMTKSWKKNALPKINAATDNGRTAKLHDWDIDALLGVDAIKSGFDALGKVEAVTTQDVQGFALRKLFGSDAPSTVKDMKNWVNAKVGATVEPKSKNVFSVKSDLLHIIDKGPDMGKAISDTCKLCSAQASKKAKEFSGLTKDSKKNDESSDQQTQAIKNVMMAWSFAQKAITSYSGCVQTVLKSAVHESMSALNVLLKSAKKSKDDGSEK